MSNEVLLSPEKDNKLHFTVETIENDSKCEQKEEFVRHCSRRHRSRTASNAKPRQNQIRAVTSKECYVCTLYTFNLSNLSIPHAIYLYIKKRC